MSSTTRRSGSQERSLRKIRQQHNKRNNHLQSDNLTEDSGFLSGASSFTKEDKPRCSARTKRGGVRPQPSTTSGMTFAHVPSSHDEDEASSSSSSSSTSTSSQNDSNNKKNDNEQFHETLTSLALSQVFPHDSVFGSIFEIDPPRPVVATQQDQSSVDPSCSTHNNNHHTNHNMTAEQKAWAGIEAVLRQSTNSVHRHEVLSEDVWKALSDSYSTLHSRVTIETAPGVQRPMQQQQHEPANQEEEASLTASPTQGLTGYLGRLTETNNNNNNNNNIPSLMNASFSSLQTDVQSVGSSQPMSDTSATTVQNAVVVDHPHADVLEAFMNDIIVSEERHLETTKLKDPPGERVREVGSQSNINNNNNKNSSVVDLEAAHHSSKGKLQRDEVNKDTDEHQNPVTIKTSRDNNRVQQQMISPRQHRKLKKPLSSSLTPSNASNDPVTPRRSRSTSPVKMRSVSPTKGEKTPLPKSMNKKVEANASRSGSAPKRRGRRHPEEPRTTKNAGKSLGDYSQETLPIDFDASLPSNDPQNLVTRRTQKTPAKNTRERHPMQFDEEDPFFSPAEFTNASAILAPKNKNHWPSLLVVSPKKEEQLSNSMPSLATLNETELSQVEAAQAREWASFGDLGLDEMIRDDAIELAQSVIPTTPKGRAGRRRTRFHRSNQFKAMHRKELVVHSAVTTPQVEEEEDNGVEAFVNYFKPEEQSSSLPSGRPEQQSTGLLRRFRRSPRKDRKKTIASIDKGGPLSKLKKGMGSLLCRTKKSASTPNAAKIDTGHRDAQFYPNMEDDRDESGYGNLLD